MTQPRSHCPLCPPRCRHCPRLAELLWLRQWAAERRDADTLAIIDAELAALGLLPPANDNEPSP